MRLALVAIALVAVLGFLKFMPSEPAPRPAEPPQPAPVAASPPPLDKSPEAQARRADLIGRLTVQGVFTKTETPGNLPRLFVGPRFHLLDIDDKEKFLGVVYAYFFSGTGPTDLVRVFDGRTGKEIGTFDRTGLKMN